MSLLVEVLFISFILYLGTLVNFLTELKKNIFYIFYIREGGPLVPPMGRPQLPPLPPLLQNLPLHPPSGLCSFLVTVDFLSFEFLL